MPQFIALVDSFGVKLLQIHLFLISLQHFSSSSSV